MFFSNSSVPPFLRRGGSLPPRLSLSCQLEAALRRAKRILILDEDPILVQAITEVANRYDVEIETASTVEAAKALLQTTVFEAAILDIKAAFGDGVELYRWILATLPQLKVLFLTVLPVETVSDKVHVFGSAPVYSKPSFFGGGFVEDLFDKLGARRKQAVSG